MILTPAAAPETEAVKLSEVRLAFVVADKETEVRVGAAMIERSLVVKLLVPMMAPVIWLLDAIWLVKKEKLSFVRRWFSFRTETKVRAKSIQTTTKNTISLFLFIPTLFFGAMTTENNVVDKRIKSFRKWRSYHSCERANYLSRNYYPSYVAKRFYVDTSIWMDLLEDRKGFNSEPLGDYALRLFAVIKAKNYKLVLSDFLIRELESNYSTEEINGMILPFKKVIEKVFVTKEERDEAKKIAEHRNLPPGDALHAIISRDNNLILITRDKHFRDLEDITKHYKPEEIISIS